MPEGVNDGSEVNDEVKLVEEILSSEDSEHVVKTTLRTDQRVLARITDGIYRQPASALRELISNAYDADATRVVIATDAPRFEKISIEDNGHGMVAEDLAHLLLHIGASAKRSDEGARLKITSLSDPFRSPNGRRLIGKIGIGLFSVSQLTHSFQIITKVKGERFRTIATVALKQYQDQEIPSSHEGKKQFESGKVNIWREKAADLASQGTTVVLTSIRPSARDTLRSREIWAAIERNDETADTEAKQDIEPPKFHIGSVDASGELLRKARGKYSSLPWEATDDPSQAFRKLVQSVWDEVEQANPNPQLERIFDYYLRMVWQVALAIPLPYVEGHLFDMQLEGWADTFGLSNRRKGAAKKIEPGPEGSIRDQFDLLDPPDSQGQFDVYFDDLKLLRPIRFRNLPTTSHALKKPLIFIGKCREEFPKIPIELSGGRLAFEAYLFWNPKIAPTEHQGSLIRIHGSSGTLFDSTFMRYQVSEQTRLRQITCEVFISEGLDGALNIDRESFNTAHPHAVYITRWLHGALRQLATAQKRLASEAREQQRDESQEVAVSGIQRVAIEAWSEETDDPASKPPRIEISEDGQRSKDKSETYVFSRSAIVSSASKLRTQKGVARRDVLEEKLKAIAQVLASFNLLDSLPKRKQEKMLKAIYKILEAPEE